MKLPQRITNALEQAILSRVKSNSLISEYYNRNGNKANWKRQATNYNAKEISDWKRAVLSATDPDDARRGDLMRFYQSLMLDNHLASVIDTRILRIQRSSYKIVNEKGEENEELKTLLERPWFDDLARLVIGKTFQGTTLIEMFDTDENGELYRVREIPQSNFIAPKGIILKEEYDQTGVSYVDGTYKDYYLQVGEDYDLGMLNQLSMIVLAKKLGLGSWMQYIDKFGVPPVFATTDRLDTTRTTELFEMLESFRQNQFVVLQGNEKVEIPNNYGSDGYQSFKTLINDVCNTEISKRILGGTALTDVKAFTGSSIVQERVAQDRYEADKLVFKYYFNTQVRQRLAKISSVYKDFLNCTLIWDNQENLDINGYIDGVKKLSSFYDFDTEEIKKRTGLPITGIKAQAITTPDPTNSQKKKPDARILPMITAKTSNYRMLVSKWDPAIERLAEQVFNGEVKPIELDKDLVLKNYAALNKSASTAYGKTYFEDGISRKIRDDLMRFSSAKAYNLVQELTKMRTGLDKESYMEKAKELVNTHTGTWLDTERQLAAMSAASANDYNRYLSDADLYPNLKYRTMEDEDVREQHQVLNGTIKPVNDPFWSNYMPPNGWKCRCFVEQTMESVSEKTPKLQLQKQFMNNPGITGQVFTKENSYQESIKQTERNAFNSTMENMKQFAPYSLTVETDAKNKVLINDFADLKDLPVNITAAKAIADATGKTVFVRPHSQSLKNPELCIGSPSNIADLKTFGDSSKSLRAFLKNSFTTANRQKCNTVVLDLTKAVEMDYKGTTARKLKGELSDKNGMNKGIKAVIIIKDGSVTALTRKEINSVDFTM